jgi:hypothetical protein
LVAYAEAFQKHLCGWTVGADGALAKSRWRFVYDFAALRQSIDASLKVRELKDTQRRQRLIFVFGFLATALGLVLGGLRAVPIPDHPTGEPKLFLSMIGVLTSHPIWTIGAAVVGAYAFDVGVTQFSAQPGFARSWIGGVSRFVEAVMGSTMGSSHRRWVSFGAGYLLLALFVAVAAALSGLTYWLAYVAISRGMVLR